MTKYPTAGVYKRTPTLCARISIGVASVPCAAGAVALVVSGTAVCIDGTLAGVHTLFISASQGGGTVGVYQALIRPAVDVWVTLVIGKANAVGTMASRLAHSICSTGGEKARVLTLLPDASLVISALRVALAPGCGRKKQLRTPTRSKQTWKSLRSSHRVSGFPSYPRLQTQ